MFQFYSRETRRRRRQLKLLLFPTIFAISKVSLNKFKMAGLVDYSSSESDQEENVLSPMETSRTSIKLPMLLQVKETNQTTSKIHQMRTSTRTLNEIETVEKHQGRTRSFEHVEGNWATHIYIDCKLQFIQ